MNLRIKLNIDEANDGAIIYYIAFYVMFVPSYLYVHIPSFIPLVKYLKRRLKFQDDPDRCDR